MFKKILYKIFGLEDDPCPSCEILRAQYEACNAERLDLLHRILDKDKEIPSESKIPLEPIQPRFIPWHVRQQMLEKEDRIAAKLMREKVEEMNPVVEQLEKELGVSDAK